MYPIARDSLEHFKNKDYLKILGDTLHMSVPAAYLWLLFLTFFISAVAHEYLMIGIIRDVNFIAFTIMIVNVPIMVLQHELKEVSIMSY